MSEAINYLRSNNTEQGKLNQIMQSLQKLLMPVTGDPKKELIVYSPESKVRLTSVTTGGANVSNTDPRNKTSLLVRKTADTAQSSYSLTDTISGTITFPTTNQKLGGRAEFASDYITIPSHTNLDVTTFSISTWFYVTGNQSSAKIIEKASSFSIEMANLQIKAGVSGENTSLYSVSANAWHNVLITFGSQTLKLYVDNVLKETKTISGTFSTNTNLIKIGENFSGALSWLNYSSGVKDSTWLSNWYSNSLIDLSTEIFTFDFSGSASATPIQVSGFVESS